MRPDYRKENRKHHKVAQWDGLTACARDSLSIDLNQTLDWDLATCKKCLKKKPAPGNVEGLEGPRTG